MTYTERIEQVTQLIESFAASVRQTERELADRLIARLADILADPAKGIALAFADFSPSWAGLIQQLAENLLTVYSLNTKYFQALNVSDKAIRQAASDYLPLIGVLPTGEFVKNGYLWLLVRDNRIQRNAYNVAAGSVNAKIEPDEVVRNLQTAMVSSKDGSGAITRFFNGLESDPHVNADRVLQRMLADYGGLRARLYIGGLRDSSRPFCVVRNGKVFLDSEIRQFGTPADKYGGYSDKSTGMFAGKPKVYDPFTDCGGHNCYHFLNAISNSEALRRRTDLQEVNGVLSIVSQ